MKLLNMIKNYTEFIEVKCRDGKFLNKVIIFILAPQIVASIVTGFSLKEVWETRNCPQSNLKKLFLRNFIIWIIAVLWFWGFWLIVFPSIIYVTNVWISKIL